MQQDKVVITDSSCFILFDKINALHVLHDSFAIVLTTPEVAKEYGFPLPNWVVIQSVNNLIRQKEFSKYVDSGEASAISLACETQCDYLILDDLKARKFAEKLGLQIKGTIGVLLYAKQQGAISAIKPYLELMQQTNFRMSESLIERFIEAAGE